MAANKKINFEKSLTELEALVQSMEDGELSLEEALKTFEKGVQLTHQCQQALHSAELKVTQLTQAQAPQETPFEQDN